MDANSENNNDANANPQPKEELPLPNFPDLIEVPLTPTLRERLGKGARSSMATNNPGLKYAGLRYFVSDASLAVVCSSINNALKEAGYKTISAKAKLNSSARMPVYGAYTKPGSSSPDLLISISFSKSVLESFQEKSPTNDNPMLEFMIPLETKKYAITVMGAGGMAPSLGRFIERTFK